MDELNKHPFETAAIVTMAVAMTRARQILASQPGNQELPPGKKKSRARMVAPIGVMAAICMAALAACTTPGPAPADEAQNPVVMSGRMVAMQRCAQCHAIDHEDMSPNPAAPAMKGVLRRYDPDMLADDLIEGIRVGHDDMPRFDLTVLETDALVAYLKSISDPPIGR